MSDKELLELSAKAAGDMEYYDYVGVGMQQQTVHFVPHCGHTGPIWNPLIDDGDALRLLVKLKMDINIENDGVTVWYYAGFQDVETISEDVVDGDFLSATRRAIVSAAAEIGKTL